MKKWIVAATMAVALLVPASAQAKAKSFDFAMDDGDGASATVSASIPRPTFIYADTDAKSALGRNVDIEFWQVVSCARRGGGYYHETDEGGVLLRRIYLATFKAKAIKKCRVTVNIHTEDPLEYGELAIDLRATQAKRR